MIAKFTMHIEICPPSYFDPNDFVLYNSHFIPIVIIYFWYFWYFTHLVWLYKPPYNFFVTLHFILHCNPQLFIVLFQFALFCLFFLSFSRLPNTPLEDDNSRDVWLSLKTLKMRVARLVNGGLQVVLSF